MKANKSTGGKLQPQLAKAAKKVAAPYPNLITQVNKEE